MLTKDKIEENKIRFMNILKDNLDPIEALDDVLGLRDYLEDSGFFTSPATTQYYGAYEGGLCEHSLNVFNNLTTLYNQFVSNECDNKTMRSLTILGLLHDVAKAGYYETYKKNVKNDQTGQWEQITCYKVTDPENRITLSTNDVNSAFIVNQFMHLSTEEYAAISNHSGGMDNKYSNPDLSNIYSKYKLALLLHLADMLDCYE